MRLHLAACALAVCCLLPADRTLAADEAPHLVETRVVPLTESGKPGDMIGGLRPLGMLDIPGQKIDNLTLSQLSGLAWDEDDGVLYAISDKGTLFHLRPIFDGDRLTGLEALKALPLRKAGSDKPLRWRDGGSDAEGIDILRGRNGQRGDAELLISFERKPRVVRFRPDGQEIGEIPLSAPLDNPRVYVNSNRMLEAVCHDPVLGVLTTPEAPLAGERKGYTRIYSANGRSWLYPIRNGSNISALECLGDRRVLVLERDFGRLFGHTSATLQFITLPAQSKPDSPVDVRTLAALDASAGHLIDNFEGLTRHRGRRFFMVSDDNDLFIQRTLLLYFELPGL
jgi:hypothetical protein